MEIYHVGRINIFDISIEIDIMIKFNINQVVHRYVCMYGNAGTSLKSLWKVRQFLKKNKPKRLK